MSNTIAATMDCTTCDFSNPLGGTPRTYTPKHIANSVLLRHQGEAARVPAEAALAAAADLIERTRARARLLKEAEQDRIDTALARFDELSAEPFGR